MHPSGAVRGPVDHTAELGRDEIGQAAPRDLAGACLRGSAWTSLARLGFGRRGGLAEASAISSRRLLRRCAGASSRLEFHTASARAGLRLASMKGFGEAPFPAAICSMLRPEATERSASSTPSPSPGRAASSLCLISSQLVRLPPNPVALHADEHPAPLELLALERRISDRRPPAPSCGERPSGIQ